MSESDSSSSSSESSSSSSSGSFGSSDDVDPPEAKPTPLWPLEVQINYTQTLEEAKEQRAKYKEKLKKAEAEHAQQERMRREHFETLRDNEKRLQDAKSHLDDAKRAPRADVPPDAIDPLDHEEFAPGTAVFVQDPPPDLKRELLKCCRPMYDPNRPDQLCFPGLMAERHTDSACWVTFRAGKLLVPNRCLQPQHATKPAQPAPKPARLLPGQPVAFGFGYLDFVRDRNGNKGVVTGLCTQNPSKLKVALLSDRQPRSIPASTLSSEQAWFSKQVEVLQEANKAFKEKAQEMRQEALREAAKLKILQEEESKLYAKQLEAENALALARANAGQMRVVQAVCWKGAERPQVWQDIVNYVKVDWAVLIQSKKRKREKKLVSLQHLQPLACWAQDHSNEVLLLKNRHRPVCMSRTLARRILRKWQRREDVGDIKEFQSHLSILKIALGVRPHTELETSVKRFFDGPLHIDDAAKNVAPPAAVAEVLRPYQIKGFQWLLNNAQNGFGSLLADDMGLGKTLQTISLMIYLKQNQMCQRPILVVVPLSLLQTWRQELHRWAKDHLSVHVFHGPQRYLPEPSPPPTEPPAKRRRLRCKQKDVEAVPEPCDVVLTSYGVLREEVNKLTAAQFGGMVLDEAQQIKNYGSKQSKAVRQVQAQVGNVRIALTGTPVENCVTDLYNLFQFLMPAYLAASEAEFEERFGRKKELLNKLKAPFFLRRQKTDPKIAADLPEKQEQTHICELSNKQRKIYQAVYDHHRGPWPNAPQKRRQQVLSVLHLLRAVCNHPACLDAKHQDRQASLSSLHFPSRDDVEASGKCAKLHEILENVNENEKILVFNVSLAPIDLLMEQIQKSKRGSRGRNVLKLVGEMNAQKREEVVNKFQNDPKYSVLLATAQVGGVGLTLTAANHVIHFDRPYNPAREDQATDRAHRIGQKKTVFVHYLVTKDTFEERLAKILEEKRQLGELVGDGETWLADYDDAGLREFFSLSC